MMLEVGTITWMALIIFLMVVYIALGVAGALRKRNANK